MTTDIRTVEQLLNSVSLKILKSDEIARLKGEKFNVFSILGMESRENKTHSNFLSSLLNPKGDHGFGNVFLNHFIEMILNTHGEIIDDLELLDIHEFTKEEAFDIRTEEGIGKVNYDENDGGRLDILISGKSWKILIENKIYAADQYRQIERYCNHFKQKKKLVFYLSLFGHPPDPISSMDKKIDKDFYLLSYNKDILSWLTKCQKEAADFPVIRESIKQYIILIRKLTGQLTSSEMEKEIIDLIIHDEKSYNAATKIANLLSDAEYASFNSIFDSIGKILEEKGKYSINRKITRRSDSCFIPLIEYQDYDIGIDIELLNSYFFFCAIKKGDLRKNINRSKEFDELATHIHNNIPTGRTDWAIAGYIKFNIPFEKSFRFHENKQFYTKLVEQILDCIKQSKILGFSG